MTGLQRATQIVAIVGGIAGGVAAIVVAYERIATTDQVMAVDASLRAVDTNLRLGLRDLAKCVDTPQYIGDSDRAERDPTCETRLLRLFEDMRSR